MRPTKKQFPLSLLLALCALLALQLSHAPLYADGIEIEQVIGPEFPGKYKHPAVIEELGNGDLYIAYYGGDGEYAEKTAVFGMRKHKGATAWTEPVVIADTPFYSDGNPVVWRAPDGVVWLFYVCRYGDTWSKSRIKAKISTDDALTWSDSFMISLEEGMMVRNRPIVLTGGDYYLPIYHETGNDRELVGDDSSSLFLRFDPAKKEWTESARIHSRLGNIQPAVVEIDPKRLVAYCRRGGGYEPRDDGYIVRSESNDGGKTWSRGIDSKFPNPNAAVDFLKLRSGNLLLLFNDNMNDRTPLTAALSKDNDRTYPIRKNIGEGDDTFAYPYAIQASDGRIHVVFTSSERTVIRHAVFREEDLGE